MSLLPPLIRHARKCREAGLDYEIVQEQATALGRLGRALEAALAALANYDRVRAERGENAALTCAGGKARAKLVQDANDALWCFVIQREACGLHDLRLIAREYGVPAEVQNRMGVFEGRPRNSSGK